MITQIENVRIFNRALTVREVRELYALDQPKKQGWFSRVIAFMGRFLTLILALSSLTAHAAVWSADSPSIQDVSTAIGQASNGDTIVLPPGSVVWSMTLTVNKHLTIQGSGIDQTVITVTAPYPNPGLNMQANGYNRITGITFNGSRLTARPAVQVSSSVVGSAVRIDHCKFVDCVSGMLISGPFGVVDHCQFVNNHLVANLFGVGDGQSNWTTYYPISFASTNYLFFEDNAFSMNSSMAPNFGNEHFWIQCGQGGSYVVRRNTFAWSSQMMAPCFDWHGDNGDGTRGSTSVQVYSNTFTLSGTGVLDKFVDARGGQSLVYSNTVTGAPPGYRATAREEWPLGNIVEGARVYDIVTNMWEWANTVNGGPLAPFYCEANCTMVSLNHAPFAGSFTQPYPHPLVLDNPPPPPPPLPPPAPQIPLVTLPIFSATNALLGAPFTVSGNAVTNASYQSGGSARSYFFVPTNGLYTIELEHWNVDGSSDSWWVDVNNDPSSNDQKCWDTPHNSGFAYDFVSWRGTNAANPQFPTNTWALTAGVTNTLYIVGREPGAYRNVRIQGYIPPSPPPPPPPPPPSVIAYLQFNNAGLSGAQVSSVLTAQVGRYITTTGTSTVQYATSDGTAKAGVAYLATSGTLTFTPGVALLNIPLTILPCPQGAYLGDINFYVTLSNSDTNSVIQPPSQLLVVLTPPTLRPNAQLNNVKLYNVQFP